MKNIVVTFASILTSLQVFAANEGPVLSKQSFSGYTMFQYSQSMNCDIYKDKIIIKRTVAGIQSLETKQLSLNDSVDKAILEAAKGPFAKEMIPADIPTTSYTAYISKTGGKVELIGFSDFGYKTINQAPMAESLKILADNLCK